MPGSGSTTWKYNRPSKVNPRRIDIVYSPLEVYTMGRLAENAEA